MRGAGLLLAALLAWGAGAQDPAAPEDPSPLERARDLVSRYLAAPDDASRQAVRAELRRADLAYPVLREAAGTPGALPGVPRTGVHREEVAVPGGPPAPYLVRLPPGHDPARAHPVLVALHHTGGAAEDMDRYWADAAGAGGVILVCPQATVKRFEGWGSTEVERASILAVVQAVRRRHAVDPDRIAVTGMSMGGHACWEMGSFYPDQWCAVFPVCGGPRREVVPFVTNMVGGPLLWQCQGARDQPELVRAVRMGIARLDAAGGSVRLDEDAEAGHTYFPDARAPRIEALCATPRPPCPERLRFLVATPSAGRFHWVRVDKTSPDSYELGERLRLVFRGEDPTEEEMFEKLWGEIERQAPRVEGWIEDNVVNLRTRGVRELTLLLDASLVRLSDPITVRVDGRRRWRGRLEPDPDTLLAELARGGDRRRLVDAALPLKIPVRR